MFLRSMEIYCAGLQQTHMGDVEQNAEGIRCEDCGKDLPATNAQLHAIRCTGVLVKDCKVFYLDKKVSCMCVACVIRA